MEKNKVLHLNSAFSIKADGDSSIMIEGYASTPDKDRQGDVVPTEVWSRGMKNYLRNPVILAYHDHSNPIGRMVEHKVDGGGLWIKARISNAAKQFQLIKDGILTAFSIGFKVLDADYDNKSEVFTIKELELVEISVVSVPANQNTLFDLSKAFESPKEYEDFKQQFASPGQSAKGLEDPTEAKSVIKKEWNMNPEEMKQMLAEAARQAAEEATKALEARQKAEQKAKADEAARQQEIDARVKAAVEAHVQVGQSGAEKLLAEVTKRFEEEKASTKNALEGLEAALKEKAAELTAIQNSKMNFQDKNNQQGASYEEIEKAVLLGKIANKNLEDTKFGRDLVTKYGGAQPGLHLPGAAPWELQVSLRMEEEIRRRLVMAPLMRQIPMQTNVMRMPLNPEAGRASWVQGTDFNNANFNSSGTLISHVLSEITLNAFKVATKEYIAYEEEEDSLIVLLPVIRDAMIRRVARAVDGAFINGVGNGTTDPVRGVAMWDTTSQVTASTASSVTTATLRALRRDIGTWGLDPSELVYVVSNDVYYDLLDDTNFLTWDKVGPNATLLTGQVGAVGNTPVIVSGELPSKASGNAQGSSNIGAFLFHPGNFVVGNQRGLRIDTADLVERQSRVLVASLRTGLTQLTTSQGMGVSTFRWVG